MNDYRIDNPMIDERFDPKPTESPTIECEVTVSVTFRMEVEREQVCGEYPRPELNSNFGDYVTGSSFDKIIDKAREILEERAGGYEVEYSV